MLAFSILLCDWVPVLTRDLPGVEDLGRVQLFPFPLQILEEEMRSKNNIIDPNRCFVDNPQTFLFTFVAEHLEFSNKDLLLLHINHNPLSLLVIAVGIGNFECRSGNEITG
jgi:hypothetical protein